MKAILLLGAICIFNFFPRLDAQVTFRNRDIVDAIDMVNTRYAIKKEEAEYAGSPYENDQFVWGDIFYRDQPPIHKVPIRYNIFEDRIEYFHNDRIMELLAYPLVDRVLIGNKVLVYLSSMAGSQGESGFFQLLEEGKVSVLAKWRVKFFAAEGPKPMKDAKPPRFERRKNDYFVELADGSLVEVKSLKMLIRQLEGDPKVLSRYAKAQNLSVNKQEDLVELIRFVNGLD